MKILFVSLASLQKPHIWSGTHYHMARALQKEADEFVAVDDMSLTNRAMNFLKQGYYKFLKGKRFDAYRDPAVIGAFSRRVEQAIQLHKPDVVVSHSSIPIALVQGETPIVFWTDACFSGMIDFYDTFSNLADETIKHGHQMEQAALDRCNLVIYSSEWAAQSAHKYYRIDKEKIKIAEFGANLSVVPAAKEVYDSIQAKSMEVCQLIWFGTNWVRKGGDVANETAQLLNNAGLKTELVVIGCDPPEEIRELPHIRTMGFVDMTSDAGASLIRDELAQAHFLILPTIADCTPHVIGEVNAFGVPCLINEVGGTASMVHEGTNGHLFPLGGGAGLYAETIQGYIRQPLDYLELAKKSRETFDQRLSWQVLAKKVCEFVSDC